MPSTSPPIRPPQFMSVTDRLNAGLAQQEAMSAKSKKDKKRKRESGYDDVEKSVTRSAAPGQSRTQSTYVDAADITPSVFKSKKDKKRKRESGGGGSGSEEKVVGAENRSRARSSQSTNGGGQDITPRIFKSKKGKLLMREPRGSEIVVAAESQDQAQSVDGDVLGGDTTPAPKSKNKHKKNRSERKGLDGDGGENLSLVGGEGHGSDGGVVLVDEGKAAKKKHKREEKAARKASKKAKLEKFGQDMHEKFDALPEHLAIEGLAVVSTPRMKINGGSDRITTPDAKVKADLLLQTVLKSCKHEDATLKPAASGEAGKNVEPKSLVDKAKPFQGANGAEVVAAKAVKPKEMRNHRPRKNAQADGTNGATGNKEDSLSQTIEAIKTSSASKINEIFSELPFIPPSRKEKFFDNEPLAKKRERMLAASLWLSSRSNATTTVAPAQNHHPAATAAPKGWATTSGKVRGIVGVNTDEEPEESAFPFHNPPRFKSSADPDVL